MTSKNFGLGGAALLAAGLFAPIVTVPILGNVNLFSNGTNLVGIDLLLLTVIAGVLAAKGRLRDLMWPGVAASAILLYEFLSLQYRLSQLRVSLSKELQGNPFAGLAQGAANAIQVQWGWLVLAVGAGLIVYAAFSAPTDDDIPLIDLRGGLSRGVAAASLVLLLFVPAWELLNHEASSSADAQSAASPAVQNNLAAPASATSEGPSAEEATYIKQNLRLYDLKAAYHQSMLDGRVPGVDFKIQNNGNRTLNGVTVRVVFYDAAGNPISEEEYNPVIVSDYSIGANTPLRPHYIWQQESDKFYEAKNVPSEWAEGKATATITDIEFAPNGAK